MPGNELDRIRAAIVEQRYTLTDHAYDEMDADHLDVLDVESAILTGRLDATLTHDPRGPRYVIHGSATDQTTPVAVVLRFVKSDDVLVLTVYEIK